MMTALIITAWLKEFAVQCVIKWIPLNDIVLALTARERWKAARNLEPNFMSGGLFILIGVIAMIILTVLLFVVSFRRITQGRKGNSLLFSEYAQKSGLSERERQILLLITTKANLKQREAIFTMRNAFELGVARIIEESFLLQGAERGIQLQAELSSLREKLGFQKKISSLAGSSIDPKKLSSRQIPIGKKLHITRRKARDSEDIESTVIKNNDIELVVQLAVPLESSPGDLWRAHYYFGASVWEFDTFVVSCNGHILVLNHSDDIRFINRRRFLRVPVRKPAFIAHFPFARTIVQNNDSKEGGQKVNGSETEQGLADVSIDARKPPEFVPAILTELAGPGLCIEAPLEVKIGDRVLVGFRLDEEDQRHPNSANREGEATIFKIIEDIGEVRHIKAVQNGFSIAVELTGLSDSGVDELIRATNMASRKGNPEDRDAQSSVDTEERSAEPATAQAVSQGV